MMRAGTDTGSLVNHVMSGSTNQPPTVGMGATILGWTDRHAATVVKVSPNGKTVTVQQDTATRVDQNGMSDAQSYTFKPNPSGTLQTFRLTKKGWRSPGGGYVTFGHRSEYYDYSF